MIGNQMGLSEDNLGLGHPSDMFESFLDQGRGKVRRRPSRGVQGVLSRVFLNRGFGEPMFCTLDSRGFRYFRGFRDFCESSVQPLCVWLSELSSSFS